MKKGYLLFVMSVTLFCHTQLCAQADTIKYDNHILVRKQLHTGMTKYLVYSEDSATQMKSGISIWERNITAQKVKDD